jgi:hypothetical protein
VEELADGENYGWKVFKRAVESGEGRVWEAPREWGSVCFSREDGLALEELGDESSTCLNIHTRHSQNSDLDERSVDTGLGVLIRFKGSLAYQTRKLT